jgi:hypothetical protein
MAIFRMLILNDSRSPASPSQGDHAPRLSALRERKNAMDYTYQIHSTESGETILVFKDGMFERKIFVPLSEHRMGSMGWVLDENHHELYRSTHDFVVNWLGRNKETSQAKMVAVGKDFQILPIETYIYLHS